MGLEVKGESVEKSLPFRKVKLLPGSIPLTTPLNWAPGGELSVTSMVSPMNVFDMSASVLCVPPSGDPGEVFVIHEVVRTNF